QVVDRLVGGEGALRGEGERAGAVAAVDQDAQAVGAADGEVHLGVVVELAGGDAAGRGEEGRPGGADDDGRLRREAAAAVARQDADDVVVAGGGAVGDGE